MKPSKFIVIPFVIILFVTVFLFVYACKTKEKYNCVHSDLSKDYSFEVLGQHFFLEDGVEDSLNVMIKVTNKHTNKDKEIHFSSRWMFEGPYTDCYNVRSYTTGVNKDSEVADNDYGDIVVADLNFDGKDDFALKANRGSTAGPDYIFYVQDKNGAFKEDRFLTDSVGYFPYVIDASKKQITTGAIAGALAVSERLYGYNTVAKKWRSLRHTLWQEYKFSKLSGLFDYTISISKIQQHNEQDCVYVAVAIADKQGNLKHEIKFGSDFFERPFTDNNSARSYTTSFNKKAKIIDGDYGNLVVADFNFDGKDDLAVKWEQGGNGGPQYKYYLQENEDVFIEDEFLNSLGFFPRKFSADTKTLTFRIRYNAYQYQETLCRYKPSLKQWFVIKQQIKN